MYRHLPRGLAYRQAGFTLIELLVVIAIIGILAGIVLTNLGSARGSANVVKIKEQMANMRTAGELYALANNSFGPATVVCTGGTTIFSNTGTNMTALISSTQSAGATLDCGANASTQWSVAATLPTSPATYWCVDSSGLARDKNAANTAYNGLTSGTASAHTGVGDTNCN